MDLLLADIYITKIFKGDVRVNTRIFLNTVKFAYEKYNHTFDYDLSKDENNKRYIHISIDNVRGFSRISYLINALNNKIDCSIYLYEYDNEEYINKLLQNGFAKDYGRYKNDNLRLQQLINITYAYLIAEKGKNSKSWFDDLHVRKSCC